MLTRQYFRKLIPFISLIGIDVLIFISAFNLYFSKVPGKYDTDELFWLFVLLIIAPILPIITFHNKNKTEVIFVYIVTGISITYLILLEPLFIPKLPILEAIGIFVYAYISVGLHYFNSIADSRHNSNIEIIYVASRLVAFFVASFAAGLIGDPNSYTANYLLIILFAIPMYVIFMSIVFIELEIKQQPKNQR